MSVTFDSISSNTFSLDPSFSSVAASCSSALSVGRATPHFSMQIGRRRLSIVRIARSPYLSCQGWFSAAAGRAPGHVDILLGGLLQLSFGRA